MKKYLVGTLLASMLVVVPFVSSAVTVAQLQAQIAKLQAQLSALINPSSTVPTPPIIPGEKRVEVITNQDDLQIQLVHDSGMEKTEPWAKATLKFKIKNITGSTLYIPQFMSPVSGTLKNMTRGSSRIPDACTDIYYTTTNVPVVYSSDRPEKQSYLQVEAGQTIDYTYMKSCPVSKMLSGDYSGSIWAIDSVTDIQDTYRSYLRQTNGVAIQTANTVIVVGETGPWLESVSLTSDRGVYRILGERLLNATIYIGGNPLHAEVLKRDSGSIDFEVPGLLDGSYPLYTVNRGTEIKSNTLSFAVSRSATATTTWSAKIDSIDYSASSRRILVPGGWVKLRGMRLTDKVTIVGTNYPPLQVRVSDNDRRVDFKLDPRMTTGSYEAYVTGANGKASNRVVLNLTGEAVVDLVEPAPGATVAPGAWVKLRGQRLTTNVNWFHPSVCAAACPIPPGECESTCYPGTKANQYPVLSAKLSDNNTRLDFKVDPRELPGQYEIEVINSWGQSNRFPFTVVGSSTTPVPAEVAPRINSISGNQYPGGWVKLSGMRLTTDVKITKADGTGTTVYVPLDIRDVNGNGTRIDFKLDPAMPVGAYYINVYSKTGMKSPTLSFPVRVRPAVSSSVSQIANVLSSLSSILGQMKDE